MVGRWHGKFAVFKKSLTQILALSAVQIFRCIRRRSFWQVDNNFESQQFRSQQLNYLLINKILRQNDRTVKHWLWRKSTKVVNRVCCLHARKFSKRSHVSFIGQIFLNSISSLRHQCKEECVAYDHYCLDRRFSDEFAPGRYTIFID